LNPEDLGAEYVDGLDEDFAPQIPGVVAVSGRAVPNVEGHHLQAIGGLGRGEHRGRWNLGVGGDDPGADEGQDGQQNRHGAVDFVVAEYFADQCVYAQVKRPRQVSETQQYADNVRGTERGR